MISLSKMPTFKNIFQGFLGKDIGIKKGSWPIFFNIFLANIYTFLKTISKDFLANNSGFYSFIFFSEIESQRYTYSLAIFRVDEPLNQWQNSGY